MATSCRITPRVRKPSGGMADSDLHTRLGAVVKDKETRDQLWATAHSTEFREAHPDAKTEKNGEIAMEYLLGKTELGQVVSDQQIADGLTELKSEESITSDPVDIHKAQKAAVEFNDHSDVKERVSASVIAQDGKARTVFSAKNSLSDEQKEQLKKDVSLYDKLAGILARHGLGIAALTEAEKGAGIDGVTDFSAIKKTINGMIEIIRLKEGERGVLALPEEAAHAAVGLAMGKNANVDRVLNLLRNNKDLIKEVLGEQYEEYAERYSGNEEALVHEAAGHLLRDALRSVNETDKYNNAKKYKSLWQRFADAIINFFKQFRQSELEKALADAEISSRKVAESILDESFFEDLKFSEDADKIGELFALTKEKTDELKDISKRMIRDTKGRSQQAISYHKKGKRYFDKTSGEWKRTRSRYQFMKDLGIEMQKSFDNEDFLDAIQLYLENATSDLRWQMKNFDKRFEEADSDYRKSYIINNLDEFCSVYAVVLKEVGAAIEEIDDEDLTDEEREKIKAIKTLVSGTTLEENGSHIPGLDYWIGVAQRRIAKLKMPIFLRFAQKFIPIDKIIVPKFAKAYGRKGGEEITLADQMFLSPEVGSIDHWLLAAALSNSFPVQAFQRIINQLQLQIRDEALDYSKRIKELTLRLEAAGYENQEFMFQTNKEGKKIRRYIEKDSKEYASLSQAQKEYYDAIIEIKAELETMIPWNLRDTTRGVAIRKDMLEQIKDADNLSFKRIKDLASESWRFTSDDPYTLSKDSMIINYSGDEFRMVPIRFISFSQEEDESNFSMDITETLSRYAQMCCNYSTMHRVQPMLELGRTIMEEGKSEKYITKKDENGNKIKVDVSTTRKSATSHNKIGDNTLDRINDILESGLYGFRSEDLQATINLGEDKEFSVSISKLGQNLMRLTAANQYMMSVNAAVQNEISALVQHVGEAAGRKYYDMSDIRWAHSIFASNLGDMFGDVNSRILKSKINLFNEMFNVVQDDEVDSFNRKGVSRLFRDKNLYFMTSMGEFHANTLIALCLAHRQMLKDASGNKVNLWDALEVVDIATKKQRDADRLRREGKIDQAKKLEADIKKHSEWHGSQNKYLVVKEGYTNLDGSEFNADSIHNFTRKSMHMTHILNGIYNPEDAAKWQRYIGGQMIGMYRKWIAPAWWRRVNGLHYSLDFNEWEEGFYRTAIRVYWTRIKQLWDKDLAAELKGHELADWEKANLRRAHFEIGLELSLIGLIALLSLYNSKHKERSFAYNTLYYYVVRTNTELGSLTPIGMASEATKILQSPSACISTIQNFSGLLGAVFNPTTWGFTEDAYVKSGKYKGMTKLERAALKSPFLPGSHQLLAFMYPEDAVKFYE